MVIVMVKVKVKVYEKINTPYCHRCHRHRFEKREYLSGGTP